MVGVKRCPECELIYEDDMDVCSSCGEKLEPYHPEQPVTSREEPEEAYRDPGVVVRNDPVEENHGFLDEIGNSYIINGTVSEINTQQYYQSRLTKVIQALIAGEPYQLSHTTFVTLFRVEERTQTGYPAQARDITLYGNMQNIFATGDDVTVTARRKGTQYVARNVYNHSVDSPIRLQPYISANVIRVIMLIALFLLGYLIYSLVTADYSSLLAAVMPLIIGIAIIWYMVKPLFKRK